MAEKKKNQGTIRSSGAEYLTYIATVGDSVDSLICPLLIGWIRCKEYFKAIITGNVEYDVVDSYQSLLNKVMT